jgi:hypothetical protein
MCGIVGVITKNKHGMSKQNTEIFSQLLYCDAVRGFDSTGIYNVNKFGNVDWMKSQYSPATLLSQSLYKETMDAAFKEGRFLVGHNRKASVGAVSDETAHPFVEEDIILVHNGTLFNHKKLADTEVDSHAITIAIKEKGHLGALKELDGAFALVWYNVTEKKLYLARNDKRPLHLLETQDSWYISSEMELADWLIQRSSYNNKIIRTFELASEKCYTFGIDTAEKFEEESIELLPKESPRTQAASGGGAMVLYGPQKKQQLGITTKYCTKDRVVFLMEDYEDMDSEHYDGLILGKVYNDSKVEVRCFFNNEDWKNFTSGTLISGEISSPVYETGVLKTLYLLPGSLRAAWILKTKTNMEITENLWKTIPHICKKCKTQVEFWEVEECHITVRGTDKYKVLCPACSEELEERLIKKGVMLPNHVH